MKVPKEGQDDDQIAGKVAEEGEAFFTEREAVIVDEDDDEGFEPDIEKAVDQGNVEAEAEAYWLGEVEGEGPDESIHYDSLPVMCSATIYCSHFSFSFWVSLQCR